MQERAGNLILVVAAHPDDEVLGCGGTLARSAASGETVQVMFLADGVGARGHGNSAAERRMAAARAAAEILGTNSPRCLGLPDNRLDSVPLLEVVQAVEEIIEEFRPRIVYTHHSGDLNVDHRVAHQAVLTATRPLPGSTVAAIYAFEVLSSTEWATSSAPCFRPNRFVDVSDYSEVKHRAMAAYHDEAREFPHARSREAIEAQLVSRGASVGVAAAEAFIVEREIIH